MFINHPIQGLRKPFFRVIDFCRSHFSPGFYFLTDSRLYCMPLTINHFIPQVHFFCCIYSNIQAILHPQVYCTSKTLIDSKETEKMKCSWTTVSSNIPHVMSQPNKVPSVWHTTPGSPQFIYVYANVSKVTRHCDTDFDTHKVTDYKHSNRWHNLTWQSVQQKGPMLRRWKHITVLTVISDRHKCRTHWHLLMVASLNFAITHEILG